MWKLYCRVYDDMGWSSPGIILVDWYRKGYFDDDKDMNTMNDEERALYTYSTDAMLWYIHECRE